MKNLILLLLLLPLSSFAVVCPSQLNFDCETIPNVRLTLCQLQNNVDSHWQFGAPLYHVNPSAIKLNQSHDKRASWSVLPRGHYAASYGFSYYGPSLGEPHNSAICIYPFTYGETLSMATLYSGAFHIGMPQGQFSALWRPTTAKGLFCTARTHCYFKLI